MATEKEINERGHAHRRAMVLRNDYLRWCKDKGIEPSEEAAESYAVAMTGAGSHDHMGWKERDILLELNGKLPFAYD